ncbi:MAG: quinolinate synthase NadA [bacterium]
MEAQDLTAARKDVLRRIGELRRELGGRVVILTHHYQRPELVRAGDLKGDSFELSRQAARADAEVIVFCGVHFMAEAAAILCRDDQEVIMPDWSAGCPMADMAPIELVEQAWQRILRAVGDEAEVMPLTYMNSAAAVKGFCGDRGGAVCTSSNAPRAMTWAFEQRPRVLFLPDQHLGRNTARKLGVSAEQVVLYRPRQPDGGLSDEELRGAKVILWQGHCHVHTYFRPEHIEAARKAHPDARVVVHPECRAEVVEAADGNGSTSYLVKAVEEAAPGSKTIIGTEINLITRLAEDYPDRTVLPLARSLCPNMFRIEPEDLRDALERLDDWPRITVAPAVASGARLALDRMLGLPQG